MMFMLSSKAFQSTHPVRGGTRVDLAAIKKLVISIHPPREGWDPSINWQSTKPHDFNPPTP